MKYLCQAQIILNLVIRHGPLNSYNSSTSPGDKKFYTLNSYFRPVSRRFRTVRLTNCFRTINFPRKLQLHSFSNVCRRPWKSLTRPKKGNITPTQHTYPQHGKSLDANQQLVIRKIVNMAELQIY